MSKNTDEFIKELQNQIEAILFASGKGVDVLKLAELCETNEKEILKVIKKLKEEYDERNSSLQITENGNKWKLTVKGKYVPKIEKLVSETEMSQTVLKTLAMIAFKSPVLQSEIIDARGQSAYDHIKLLVKEKFVTKEESGRSFILKITDKFYEYFDVEGDEEIRELFSKLKEQHIQKLGELEVVDIDEEKANKTIEEPLEKNDNLNEEKSLLGLKVVDSDEIDDHEDIFNDERKQKFKEEKENQKEFLSDIDSKIEEISKRIGSHEDIVSMKKEEENEESNNSNENENNYENKDDDEENNQSQNENSEKNKFNNENNNENLKSLEEFAENQKQKKEEEDFI